MKPGPRRGRLQGLRGRLQRLGETPSAPEGDAFRVCVRTNLSFGQWSKEERETSPAADAFRVCVRTNFSFGQWSNKKSEKNERRRGRLQSPREN